MFSDSQLRVNGSELGTDTKRSTSSPRITNHRGAVDNDIADIRGNITPFVKQNVSIYWKRAKPDLRMMLKIVVLPAPLGPSKAKTVSFPTPMLTLSTTFFPLKDFETLMTRRRSSDAAADSAAAITSSFNNGAVPVGEVVFWQAPKLPTVRDPALGHARMTRRTDWETNK